jgi:hypothetical protein
MQMLRVLLTKSFAAHYSLSLINTTLHNLSDSADKYNSLFVFLSLQPIAVYFHSPVAGFSLFVFEVSLSHSTTRHSR